MGIQMCIRDSIEGYLAEDIPEALRGRLELEKIRLIHLPADFPYTYPQAMALIHETIPDFTDEEFAVLEDAGRIDCIFVEGLSLIHIFS